MMQNNRQLETVGESLAALTALDNVMDATKMGDGLMDSAVYAHKLGVSLSSYSLEATKAALAQRQLTKDQLTAIFAMQGLQGETLETTVEETMQIASTNALSASQDKATGSTTSFKYAMDGLGNSMKKAWMSFKNFMFNPTGIMLGVGAAILTASAVAAYKHATAFDKATEVAQESQSAYKDSASELSSLNSELETSKSRLEELQALKDAGTISVVENEELNQLQLQNKDLQRKIDLQKEAVDLASKTAVDDAMTALGISTHQDLTQSHTTYDKTGMVSHTQYKETDLITASKNELEVLQSLKDERKKLLEDDIDNKTQTDDFEKLDSEISRYEKSLENKLESVSSLRDSFLTEDGLLKRSLSQDEIKAYQELTSILDGFNNIDLSPAQRDFAKIESFFDGSSGRNAIKEKLLDSSSSTRELEEELSRLGLTLDDIGIGNIGFLYDYLKDIKEAAKEATDSVQDYSSSVSDIEAASESADQDKNWSTISEAYKEAKELLKEGKTGTDNFQTMASFLNPAKVKELAEEGGKYTADAYQKAFEEVKKTANRWFGEDETKSMENFVNDFKKEGLFDVETDEMGLWDIETNFKTTAEAADEFGISIEAVETMLEALGAYGYDFGDVMFSGDAISEYESHLENIRNMSKNLDDSSFKDKLEAIIDDADTKDFENRIEELTPEIVADIKFEYDLAQIDLEIQKLRDRLSYAGYEDTSANAELMASNDYRSETWRAENTGIKKDSGYMALDDTISNMRKNLNGKSGEELANLQKQVMAAQELRTAFENAFDIAELNGEKIDWESYINSNEANQTLSSIAEDFNLTEEELEKIFGKDFDFNVDTSDAEAKIANIISTSTGKQIIMSVDATTEQIEEQINDLENGDSILFTAEVDGESLDVLAEKNLNGEITYKTVLADGSTQWLTATQNKDGTVTYTPITTEVDSTNYDQNGNVHYKGIFPDKAPTIKGTIEYVGKIINNIGANLSQGRATRISTGDSPSVFKRYGTVLSPAHKDGTAYNVLNTLPISAYASGKVGLDRNQQAIVNEEYINGHSESIVRDGVWRLIPGGAHVENLKKGDMIFSAQQTEDLLRSGRTSGHARAYAQGTVLTSAYRLGSGSGGSGDNGGGSSSSKNEAEKIDWIERVIKAIERTIENFGKTVEATFKKWATRNSAISKEISSVNKEIKLQKKAYTHYIKEANSVGLSSTYKKKVQNGTIDIQSIKSESTREKISEYQEWYDKALEAKDVIADLEADIADLAKEKFDNVAAEYEAKLSVTEHEIDMLEGAIDNLEAKGYVVTEDYYNKLIAKEKENKKTLAAEKKALTTALSTAMKEGKIAKYSEDWYDMQSQIQDVEKAIQDADTSLAEYQNDIWELDWSNFERLQDEIAKVRDESDLLIGLMSDEDMYDSETGQITDEGLATMGLHAVNYDVYKSQIADYAKKINELNDMIDADPTNTILLEQRDELIEQQREMVEGMKNEEQAVKDLAEQGYDALLGVLEKSIDKRKEALNDVKDLYNYEKSISEQTKNISSLEKQLEIAKKDTSESGRLNAQKLQNELDEAKKELEETEYDKFIDDQEKLYDNLMSDAEEFFDNRLKNTELILEEAVAATNEGANTIKKTLEDMAKGLGIELSDEMTDILTTTEQVSDIVEGNSETAVKNGTTTDNTLADIEHKVDVINGTVKEETGTNIGSSGTSTVTPSTSTTNTKKKETKKETSSNSSSKWGSWFIKKKYTGNKSKLNKNTSIVDRLRYYDFDSSFSARAKYYKAMGLGSVSSYKGTAKQNTAMIKKMRANGFYQGGTIGNLIKRTGEDGFVLAKSGETIITPETVAKLTEALQLAQPILDYTPTISNLSPISRNINTTIDIGDIIMNGVNDPKEFAVSLKYALQHNNDVKNIIQADTLGIMTGKNSLTKHKY